MKRYSAFLALLFTVAFGVHVLAQPAGFGGQPIGFPHASSGGGGGGAPTDATYITQTPNGTLTNEQALSALSTGILKNTTTTGVLSIAVEGTDYYKPGGTKVAVADGGTNLGSYTAGDILYASGATTLSKLAANSTATKKYLQSVSSGNPSWVQVAFADLSGNATIAQGGTNNASLSVTNNSVLYADGSKVVSLAPGSKEQSVGFDSSGNVAVITPPFVPSVWATTGMRFGQAAPATITATSATVVGPFTAYENGTQSSGTDSDGICVNYASVATSGSRAGWVGGLGTTRFDSAPVVWYRFKWPASGDLLVQRFIAGLTSNGNTSTSSDNLASIHIAGVRYSTNASDTAFQAICSNGSSETVATTGVTPVANTIYVVCVDCRDLNNIRIYINGALTNTLTTNTPSGSQMAQNICGLATLENVTKNLKIYSGNMMQK